MNIPSAPAPRAGPRFDPFLAVHKAVRHVMFETMTQVGALDTADISAVDRCAGQVGRLATLLPAWAGTLLPLRDALHRRDALARQAAAGALYDEVTALVSMELQRQMNVEAVQAPALQGRHDDAELRAERRSRLAAMDEAGLADALRAMAVALSPSELASVFDDLQASVDAQAFSCLVDTVRRQLGGERWARIARETGLSEVHAAPVEPRHRPGSRIPAGKTPAPSRRTHRAERHRLLAQ